MPAFAAALALLSLALAGAKLAEVYTGPWHLVAGVAATAFAVAFTRRGSTFVRVLVALIAGLHALLVALNLVRSFGLVPEGLSAYVPPASTPTGAAVFALIVLGLARVPAIRAITDLADPFFEARETGRARLFGFSFQAPERWIAIALFGVVIMINFVQVALTVRLNFFSRDLFNALNAKNGDAFWYQLFIVFSPLAAVFVALAVIEIVMTYLLRIRWRAWLTSRYVGAWLGGGTHYRMQLSGQPSDNPDQRIAEDIDQFVERTLYLVVQIVSQSATLVSFTAILWTLSTDLTLPGTGTAVPGLLVWVALGYAVLGTVLTHLVGRPLIPLNFAQQRREADFRFSLARLREYAEQVALLRGERAEEARLGGRFHEVIVNFLAITNRQKKLTALTASYFQLNVVVPYIVAAPFYFSGKIDLGQLQQTAGAFSRVEQALSVFITVYATIANYKSVVDRLTGFNASIASARAALASDDGVRRATGEAGSPLRVAGLELRAPEGRVILRAPDLAFQPGERTLLMGPSGSGKSTLLRAVAGVWPFGEGTVSTPRDARVLLLPQRPYIPQGTLRGAVSYPEIEGAHPDAAIADALRAARLPALADRIGEEAAWSQVLSLGEQQRVAIARALLTKPDWLFLDEATAALDEPTEAAIYRVLAESLPEATIVSIGHRSTLVALHDRLIELRADGDAFAPADALEAGGRGAGTVLTEVSAAPR